MSADERNTDDLRFFALTQHLKKATDKLMPDYETILIMVPDDDSDKDTVIWAGSQGRRASLEFLRQMLAAELANEGEEDDGDEGRDGEPQAHS